MSRGLGDVYKRQEVNRVLFEDKPAKEAVSELMLRDRKIEHSSLEWK